MLICAGHSFPDFGPCSRSLRWMDIRNAGTADVGQEGFAHVGTLTAGEYASIVVARDAEDVRIGAAMKEVGG